MNTEQSGELGSYATSWGYQTTDNNIGSDDEGIQRKALDSNYFWEFKLKKSFLERDIAIFRIEIISDYEEKSIHIVIFFIFSIGLNYSIRYQYI